MPGETVATPGRGEPLPSRADARRPRWSTGGGGGAAMPAPDRRRARGARGRWLFPPGPGGRGWGRLVHARRALARLYDTVCFQRARPPLRCQPGRWAPGSLAPPRDPPFRRATSWVALAAPPLPCLCAVLLAGVFKEVGTEPRGRGRPRQGPTWSFLAKNAENGNSRVKESPS